MRRQQICVFGAGAVGGVIAARLALGAKAGLIDAEVSVVIRGAHLAAVRHNGCFRLKGVDGIHDAPVRATDDAASLGHQDVVIVCIKAHGWIAAAPSISSLIGPRTTVLCIQNGIPWYLEPTLDSNGGPTLSSMINRDCILGGIVYLAATVLEPGYVEQFHKIPKIVFGEVLPQGNGAINADGVSERARGVASLLRAGWGPAGEVEVVTTASIRNDVWLKLWGNLAFNLIGMLTLGDMGTVLSSPEIVELSKCMMAEAAAVAARLEPPIVFAQTIEERMAVTASISPRFKTSTLQDVEALRPVEVEAIGGTVVELAAKYGVPVPRTATVVALAKLRANTLDAQISARDASVK